MYRVYANNKLLYAPGYPASGNHNIMSPQLSFELGAAGSFTATIPTTNDLYDQLNLFTTIITIYNDDAVIWRGRIINVDFDFYNNMQITCEGAMAFLNDSLYAPENGTLKLYKLFKKIFAQHNESVEDYKSLSAGAFTLENVDVAYSGSYTKCVEVLNNLVSTYGGYLLPHYSETENFVDWVSTIDKRSSLIIDFSKNMTDLTKSITAENVVTCVVPIGKDGLTLGSKYVQNETAVALFGKIWATVEYSEIETADALAEKATEYLNNNIWSAMEINVSAMDINLSSDDTESLQVGQLYRIRSALHNIDHEFVLSACTLDLADPTNSSYTFNGSTIWTQINIGKDLDEVIKSTGDMIKSSDSSLTSRNAAVEAKTSGSTYYSGDVEFSDGTKLTFSNGMLTGGESTEGSF